MTYFFSKYKFSNGIFYKRIELADVEKNDTFFGVSIIPFFAYSGQYQILSIVLKDSNRTVYRTIKSDESINNLTDIEMLDEFFVSLSHNGRKVMIFQSNMNGIILKQ